MLSPYCFLGCVNILKGLASALWFMSEESCKHLIRPPFWCFRDADLQLTHKKRGFKHVPCGIPSNQKFSSSKREASFYLANCCFFCNKCLIKATSHTLCSHIAFCCKIQKRSKDLTLKM